MEEFRDAARARVETAALSAKLLDAAFAIISYDDFHRRFGPLSEQSPPIGIGVLSDRFSGREINDACRRVRALLQDAYQAGEDALSNRLRHSEIVDRLRQDHPGFSDNCYQRTIHQGCFLAR